MRVLTVLAAALAFSAATAFPFVEEVPGKSLVRRGGNHPGSRRGGSRERKAPGTKGREKYHQDAPALDKDRVHKSIKASDQYHDQHAPYGSLPMDVRPPSQHGYGESYMQQTTNDLGAPHYKFQMGNDRGGDHISALMDRETRIPQSSDAQYLPASPHEHESRRHGAGGTLAGLPHHRHIGSTHEEKFAAGGKPVNLNYKKIGVAPATVYDTASSTSSHQDGPAMKMGKQAAEKDPNPYASYGAAANPSSQFRQEYNQGLHPTYPLRAPEHPGLPKPVYEYQKDPGATYGFSSGLTDRSSSGGSRSDSPAGDGGTSYRVRDDRTHHKKHRRHHRSRHDDDDRDRRRHSKRDVVERIGKHQSNSDSQSEEGQKTNAKQVHQELMESYDAVVSNATDLILPILYEMVNGSNSYLVWDAAWEIASLANPGIMVVGGPFSQGMHSFDYWEKQIEGKVDPDTFQSVLALNGVLIPLYQETWKKCNETLAQEGYLDLLDQIITALQTNDTSLAEIKPDPSNTNAINDIFLYGPDESELAWWPGDEEADALMFSNSTSGALNSTSSSLNSTLSGSNSTSLSSSPSNLTASPRAQQEQSNSTAKGAIPIDSRAKMQ